MGNRSAVVLVFDGLGPGSLGPYGNTWLTTPSFNQLAAESWLIEYAIADCPRSAVRSQLRSLTGMWDGRHVLCPPAEPPGLLFRQCAAHEIHSALVCDDPQLAEACAAIGFEQIRSLSDDQPTVPAAHVSATRFGQLIAETLDELDQLQPRYCLWVHASTLVQAWDAPIQLRDGLLDDDDPDPPEFVSAPNVDLDQRTDPDAAWGLSVRYAAEVRAIDACLAVLLDAMHAQPKCQDALFLLTATHGYPLGEHRVVGATALGTLHSELVHVPLLVRYPNGMSATRRDQRLCQSPSVYATLADWLGCDAGATRLGADPLSGLTSQRAVSQLGGQHSLRTPAWHALVGGDTGADHVQLYVKPDDRWDFNEVAELCPDEVGLARHELAEFVSAAQRESLDGLPELPPALCEVLR